MSVINCPECGHSVSDKAPVCPSCGIEIKGNIVLCSSCNRYYIKGETSCPHCGAPASERTSNRDSLPGQAPVEEYVMPETRKKKSGVGLFFTIVLIILLILGGIAGGAYYVYNDALSKKEAEAFKKIQTSNDVDALNAFLDRYTNAPEEHVSFIKNRIEEIEKTDKDWENAYRSKSASAIRQYVSTHAGSPYIAEAERVLDSIDWASAKKGDNMKTLQFYVDNHPNGEFIAEAQTKLEELKSFTISDEDKARIQAVCKRFLQSINSKSASGIEATTSNFLTSFLNQSNVDRDVVYDFMNKLFSGDIINLNWHILSDYDIKKVATSDGDHEYHVEFNVSLNKLHSDKTNTSNGYRVKATLSKDFMITALNMSKRP